MARTTRSQVVWGLALVVAVLALVFGAEFFYQSPGSELDEVLRNWATLVSSPGSDEPQHRRERIQSAVRQHVAPDARIQIAELPAVTRPDDALVEALVGIVEPGEIADVELVRIDVDRHGEGARVEVDARLSGDRGRDLHSPHRHITLHLERNGAGWRIIGIDVPAATLAEPEARP